MLVKFFGPHPGVGGAAVPLPQKIKELIDTLDGMELEIAEAVGLIQSVIIQAGIQAEVEISDKFSGPLGHGALLLWMPGKNAPPPKHLWPLIRFQVL